MTPSSERGAAALEYALLVSLIAIVALAAVAFLGSGTSSKVSVMGVQYERTEFGPTPPDVTAENYFGPGKVTDSCAGNSQETEHGENCTEKKEK